LTVGVHCVIAKVPLFQDTPVEFVCELSLHVVRYVFSPGEVIIHSNEPVHEMYIVHRGVCQVFLSHLSQFSVMYYAARNQGGGVLGGS